MFPKECSISHWAAIYDVSRRALLYIDKLYLDAVVGLTTDGEITTYGEITKEIEAYLKR